MAHPVSGRYHPVKQDDRLFLWKQTLFLFADLFCDILSPSWLRWPMSWDSSWLHPGEILLWRVYVVIMSSSCHPPMLFQRRLVLFILTIILSHPAIILASSCSLWADWIESVASWFHPGGNARKQGRGVKSSRKRSVDPIILLGRARTGWSILMFSPKPAYKR